MSSQTSGGPAAKRRRVEAANATLRKPFRSPLISRQQNPPTPDGSAQASPSANRASTSSTTTATSTPAPGTLAPRTPATPVATAARRRGVGTPPTLLRTTTPTPNPGPRPGPRVGRPVNPARRSTRAEAPGHDADKGDEHDGNGEDEDNDDDLLLLLQRMRASQRELDAHVRAATQRLEQARQAGRIERAARAYRQRRRPGPGGKEEEEEGVVEVGAELRELVGRWRDASRAAAEELFGFVRARVEGMGGARVWRESRRWQWQGGFGRDEVEGVSSREGGEGEGVEEEEEGLNGEEEVSSRQRGEMNSQADTFSFPYVRRVLRCS